MRAWVAVAGLALVLAGCGKDPISEEEAYEIASKSQDAGVHYEKFTRAIMELSTKKSCQADYMRDFGGFWRDSDGPYYFIHCGTLYSDNNVKTWYYDPSSDTLTRYESDLR